MSNHIKFGSAYEASGDMPRGDLYVFDVADIDREKCAVLIGHDPTIAPPTVDNIHKFVSSSFGGKVVAQTATLKAHPFDHAVSLVLTANAQQRPASDTSLMRKITATTYSEKGSPAMWSLVQGSQGPYLVRNVEENIGDIVARVKRANHNRPGLTLGNVKTAAPYVDVGDSVKFFGPSNQIMYGAVSSVDGDHVTIKTRHDSQSYTVSRFSVVAVSQKGKDAQERERSRQEDFYAVVFGDRKFAEELCRRDVNDDKVRDDVPSFTK